MGSPPKVPFSAYNLVIQRVWKTVGNAVTIGNTVT